MGSHLFRDSIFVRDFCFELSPSPRYCFSSSLRLFVFLSFFCFFCLLFCICVLAFVFLFFGFLLLSFSFLLLCFSVIFAFWLRCSFGFSAFSALFLFRLLPCSFAGTTTTTTTTTTRTTGTARTRITRTNKNNRNNKNNKGNKIHNNNRNCKKLSLHSSGECAAPSPYAPIQLFLFCCFVCSCFLFLCFGVNTIRPKRSKKVE